MAGRNIRIFRMNDQRHAHGFKRRACQFRTMGRSRSRHFCSLYMRKIHTGLLEYCAVFQYTGFADTQLPSPYFMHKFGFAIFLLQRGADLVLQCFEEG